MTEQNKREDRKKRHGRRGGESDEAVPRREGCERVNLGRVRKATRQNN